MIRRWCVVCGVPYICMSNLTAACARCGLRRGSTAALSARIVQNQQRIDALEREMRAPSVPEK